ncbi:MAG TPA: sensor domain-containing diguanylate cyclase [Roseiflexaceae bacterium]
MPPLDLRTTLILVELLSLVNAAVMTFIYRIAPRYRGSMHWVIGNYAFAAGWMLLLLRGVIPDLVSIIGTNLPLLLGCALIHDGLGRFLDARPRRRISWTYPWIGANLLLLGYYAVVVDNVAARIVIISSAISAVLLANAWLLVRHAPRKLRLSAGFTAVAFAVTAMTSLTRGGGAAIQPVNDVFATNTWQQIGFVGSLVGTTLCTAGLAGLVVQRLLGDLRASQETTRASAYLAQQRIQVLEAMSSTLAEILAERSQRQLLQSIVARAAALLDVNVAELLIFDEARGALALAARHPPVADQADHASPRDGAAEHVEPARRGPTDDDDRSGPGAHSETTTRERAATLDMPLLQGQQLVGVLRVGSAGPARQFNADDKRLLNLFAQQATVAILNARLYDQLVTDPLTGLNNRGRFFELAEPILSQAQAGQQPLVAALIDIDHFKRVNDSYGHAIGDDVLTWVATQCREQLPADALLGRIGGEEFAVLLPGADVGIGQALLEAVRRHIAGTDATTRLLTLRVTVSAGVVELAHIADVFAIDQLLDRADQALYQAKRAGRNRVCVWQCDPAAPGTRVAADRLSGDRWPIRIRRPWRYRRMPRPASFRRFAVHGEKKAAAAPAPSVVREPTGTTKTDENL